MFLLEIYVRQGFIVDGMYQICCDEYYSRSRKRMDKVEKFCSCICSDSCSLDDEQTAVLG